MLLSTLSSRSLVDLLFRETRINPGFAIQKFNRLIATGLLANDVIVKTCSGIPITQNKSSRLVWWIKDESEDGIAFHYPFFLNIHGLRNIFLIINSFFYILKWGFKHKEDKYIICDILNQSVCIGGLYAAKILGIKAIGLVTDMPGMIVEISNRNSLLARFRLWCSNRYLSFLSGFVFISEAANAVLNSNGKPYMIMEGIVDTVPHRETTTSVNQDSFIIMYAGGIFKQYGA